MATPSIDLSAGLVPMPQSSASPGGIDLSAGLVPNTGQDTVAYSTGAPANNSLQDALTGFFTPGKEAAVGAAKGIGQTLNTAGQAVRAVTGVPVPDETAKLQPQGAGEDIGAGLESIAEFMLGDEALKGASLADRLGIAGKVAKLAEQHPVVAKLLQAGMLALRQGSVGTAQGLAHGATPGQAVEQGAVAGGVGGAAEAVSGVGNATASAARGIANRLYGRAMAPAGKVDKAVVQEAVPRLAKEVPFAWSLNNLQERIEGHLDQAGAKLAAVEDSLPPDLKVDVDGARKSLKNYADHFTVKADPNAPPTVVAHQSPLLDQHGQPIITHETIPAPTEVEDNTKFAHSARSTAQNISAQLGQIDPSVKSVITQRRLLDEGLQGVYNGADPDVNGAVQAQKRAADILRGHIATASPEMAKANAEYSFWKKVDGVAQNTLTRRIGQAGGLVGYAGGGIGSAYLLATGRPKEALGVLATMDGMQAVLRDVPSLTTQARLLNVLADTVGSGDIQGTASYLAKNVGPAAAITFMRGVKQAQKPESDPNLYKQTFLTPSGRQVGVGDKVTHEGHTGTVVGQHPTNGKAVVRWESQ